MSLSTIGRRAIKAACLPLGLSRLGRNDLVLLIYHRVGDGTREIDLKVDEFESQVRYLSTHHRLLTLDEALLPGRPGGVVLTFDDGYADFIQQVVPLLESYRVPALLYLATGLVGTGHLDGLPESSPLTWDELREVTSSGLVTVGAHTHTHANLARTDELTVERELRMSKDLIEDNLGVRCEHFAYPWGATSPAAEALVERNFHSAALGNWRNNRSESMDPQRLGRTPVVRSDGQVFLRAKARGLLEREGAVYRLLGRGPWGQG